MGGKGTPGGGKGTSARPGPEEGDEDGDVDAATGSFALAGRVILADGTFFK